jgi:hypothetical protein
MSLAFCRKPHCTHRSPRCLFDFKALGESLKKVAGEKGILRQQRLVTGVVKVLLRATYVYQSMLPNLRLFFVFHPPDQTSIIL